MCGKETKNKIFFGVTWLITSQMTVVWSALNSLDLQPPSSNFVTSPQHLKYGQVSGFHMLDYFFWMSEKQSQAFKVWTLHHHLSQGKEEFSEQFEAAFAKVSLPIYWNFWIWWVHEPVFQASDLIFVKLPTSRLEPAIDLIQSLILAATFLDVTTKPKNRTLCWLILAQLIILMSNLVPPIVCFPLKTLLVPKRLDLGRGVHDRPLSLLLLLLHLVTNQWNPNRIKTFLLPLTLRNRLLLCQDLPVEDDRLVLHLVHPNRYRLYDPLGPWLCARPYQKSLYDPLLILQSSRAMFRSKDDRQ